MDVLSGTIEDFLVSEGISTIHFAPLLRKPFLFLVHSTLKELKRLVKDVQISSLQYILEKACQIVLEGGDFQISTALASADERSDTPLTLGCTILDTLFHNEQGDGIARNSGIVEIFGPAGAGKSQFCLQLLLRCQFPKYMGGFEGEALYLTSELFPRKRLDQMTQKLREVADESPNPQFLRTHPFLDNIFVETFANFEEQENVILYKLPTLLLDMNVKLIVIDSIASLMRIEYESHEMIEKSNEIFKLAQNLKRISSVFGVPIIVTNQVTAYISHGVGNQTNPYSRKNEVIPSLGLSWSNCVNTRIRLSKLGVSGTKREMEVVFSNQWEAGRRIGFFIDDYGVHGIAEREE